MKILRAAICLFLVSLGPLTGQGPTLIGSGYSDPSIIGVAPGQITTLFVTGLETVLPSGAVNAASVPLPTSLAGISVLLSQSGQEGSPIPLLSIEQVSACGDQADPAPDCLITAITVQVPFDLMLPPAGLPTELTIVENGNSSELFFVNVASSNLHVVNGCDDFPMRSGGPCGGVVTHGDGTLVTESSPARAGETVVIYAFGLGKTTLAVTAGDVAPAPAPTLLDTTVVVDFDFRPNAAPSRPYVRPPFPGQAGPVAPEFVGLTPGQVGLYQINVRIPDTIPPAPLCSLELGIVSNLTIDIGSTTSLGVSFGGAQICVEPPL